MPTDPQTDSRTARARGAAIERIAAQWLGRQSLVLLASNHRGELDLVMRDGETLVFVEVKHRVNSRYGHPLETVTPRKQQRLVRAARFYLARNKLSCGCRFDVLAVTGTLPDLSFTWVKAAFDAF
ncbi:YraN family protein [Vreelandella rituensis]|uniref:UPF0102 protein DU506_14730 n=1 Tax=Vreelandella rituensis TaxID=2282306 RepID=A0A368TVY2_9GAMM|nr:YraN family protein [Halomonas rituensis]RCV88496.1 YraN family protein [Halomonas rituensis]